MLNLDPNNLGFMHRMVNEERGIQKSRSFNFRRMFDGTGRHTNSVVPENENGGKDTIDDNKLQIRSQAPKPPVIDIPPIANVLNRPDDKGPAPKVNDGGKSGVPPSKDRQPSDMDLMKERYAKLLLGEDMSGGGKGVSSALALSNAITNLAASVFGEQRKLEPMAPDRKTRWKKEVDWLLAVTDYIVEFVPSQQVSKDGKNMEIMVTQQRKDLLMNIPALRKLDTMLIDCLDNFQDQNEFWYVSRDADESEKGVQRDDKWWLPTVKVPPSGLSDSARKLLQYQKEAVNQVLKASLAINAQVLSEMEIPENYIESLPKNGRSSLGDSIYKSITVEFFDPEQFLSTMDLSSEHKVLDLKNRIEASIVIWKRKMHHKDGKGSWGSAMSLEKRELFEERAETILLLLKQRFPGIPQSSLDISKIQYNRDVGHAILESYSRVLESLANTVMNRIEDVLYADSLALDPSLAVSKWQPSREASPSPSPSPQRSGLSTPAEEADRISSVGTPSSMTLLDFMGWSLEQGETEIKKNHSYDNLDAYTRDENEKTMGKPSGINPIKKLSYIEKIEMSLRSPTARQ